jgi:hypothetical protein
VIQLQSEEIKRQQEGGLQALADIMVVHATLCMAVVLKVQLPCVLRVLTLHFEEKTGAKIFWGFLPTECRCCTISLKSKQDVFVFSFCPALNMSSKIYPLFFILFICTALFMRDTFHKTFGNISSMIYTSQTITNE